jgi:hypothetical protein
MMGEMKANCACHEGILVSSKEVVEGRGATRRGHISGKGEYVNVTWSCVIWTKVRYVRSRSKGDSIKEI